MKRENISAGKSINEIAKNWLIFRVLDSKSGLKILKLLENITKVKKIECGAGECRPLSVDDLPKDKQDEFIFQTKLAGNQKLLDSFEQ